MRVIIRTNGRGNAWPLELGAHGPRHDALVRVASEYANTSLSILGYDGPGAPSWEVLFDVGQGVGVGSGYVQKVVTRASRTEAAGNRGDLAGRSYRERTGRSGEYAHGSMAVMGCPEKGSAVASARSGCFEGVGR